MKMNSTLKIIIALILFVALSYIIYIFNQKGLSYVNISINPDVTLALNSNDVVEQVIPVNEDADVLTSDLNLVGMNVDEATEKLVGEAALAGYLDEYDEENTVIVTATNDDENKRSELQEKIVSKVNKRLQEKKIYAVVVSNGVTDAMKETADKYDISYGKMLLVSKARELSSYTEEELADMSVKDIQAVIKDYVSDRHAELKASKEELKDKWQSEKKTLKETYKSKIEDLKETLLESTGVDVNNLTKEQKSEIMDSIKEELAAKKESIKELVEKVKTEMNNTSTNTKVNVKEKINSIRDRIKNKGN